MALAPRQALAIKRSTATINLWFGSVRSGKTHASLWKFLERCANHTGAGQIVVIGVNLNTVWSNIFQLLLSHQDFAAVRPFVQYRNGAGFGKIFGHEFRVVGANDETSWLKIQGMTIETCLGDEVVAWPKSFWEMLESRLSLDNSWFLGTCNPGTSNHYLVEKVLDPARKGNPDYHIEKMLLRHNPFVPMKVKSRFEKSYTGVFRRRMILGEWVAAEGAVYEDWDPDRMVVKARDIPEISRVLAMGVDYGTRNPTVGEVLAVGVDNRLYLTEEWRPKKHQARLTDKMLVDDLKRWRDQKLEAGHELPRYTYVDPAAASFKEEMRVQRITPHDADNDVTNGISVVASELSSGNLLISESCKLLLEEIPGYRWDEKAALRTGKESPIKENDHACDGMRYAIFSSRHIWRRLVKQHSLMV